MVAAFAGLAGNSGSVAAADPLWCSLVPCAQEGPTSAHACLDWGGPLQARDARMAAAELCSSARFSDDEQVNRNSFDLGRRQPPAPSSRSPIQGKAQEFIAIVQSTAALLSHYSCAMSLTRPVLLNFLMLPVGLRSSTLCVPSASLL